MTSSQATLSQVNQHGEGGYIHFTKVINQVTKETLSYMLRDILQLTLYLQFIPLFIIISLDVKEKTFLILSHGNIAHMVEKSLRVHKVYESIPASRSCM